MSQQHEMPKGLVGGNALPVWVRFQKPADADERAFEAWCHTPSRCRLVKVWIPTIGKELPAGGGSWQWWVQHPRGPAMCVVCLGPNTEYDVAALIRRAEDGVRACVEEVAKKGL